MRKKKPFEQLLIENFIKNKTLINFAKNELFKICPSFNQSNNNNI